MALNNLGLGFVLTARDLASGAIQNLERNFMSLDRRVGLGTENIQSAFQQLGVGLAVFTAGAAAVGRPSRSPMRLDASSKPWPRRAPSPARPTREASARP